MQDKGKRKDWWGKLKEKKGLDVFLVLLILAIIVGIYASTYLTGDAQQQEQQQQKQQEASEAGAFSDETEQKLCDVLRCIRGAGDVRVMITYDSSSELVPAFNTQTQTEDSDADGQGAASAQSMDSQVATVQQSGGEQPIVLREDAPKVRGVLIVAKGATDPGVRIQLTQAVCTLLCVPASDVQVLAMQSGVTDPEA